MRSPIILLIVFLISIQCAVYEVNKPFCNLCLTIIEQLDEALKRGDDIEKAVHEFCAEDVPEFLADTCEKVIAKNLDYIIEHLKDHEPPLNICSDIYMCRPSRASKKYFAM